MEKLHLSLVIPTGAYFKFGDMGDYEVGYDPTRDYNRNAFIYKTPLQALMGPTVKIVVTPIGLTSEVIHHHKDKNQRSQSQLENSLKPELSTVLPS